MNALRELDKLYENLTAREALYIILDDDPPDIYLRALLDTETGYPSYIALCDARLAETLTDIPAQQTVPIYADIDGHLILDTCPHIPLAS